MAQLSNAELDLTRYRTLLAQNSISAQQVATQQALVGQYRGTVASDRGSVASAKLQLSYSRVTAPVSGRVGLKQVDLGNIVHDFASRHQCVSPPTIAQSLGLCRFSTDSVCDCARKHRVSADLGPAFKLANRGDFTRPWKST